MNTVSPALNARVASSASLLISLSYMDACTTADGLVYGCAMGKTTQVAFQIDDDSLTEIDALVTGQYRSRAEVIRVAVHDWLARRHAEQVDVVLARGYGVTPTGPDEDVWAELSVQGLEAGELDW